MNSIIGHNANYTPTALQQNFYPQQQQQTQHLKTTIPTHMNTLHTGPKATAVSTTSPASPQQSQLRHSQLNLSSRRMGGESIINNTNNMANPSNNYINLNSFHKQDIGNGSANSNNLCGGEGNNGNNCNFNKLINSC